MTAIEWGLIATVAGVLVTIVLWFVAELRANKFRNEVRISEMVEEQKKNMILTMLEVIRQKPPSEAKHTKQTRRKRPRRTT